MPSPGVLAGPMVAERLSFFREVEKDAGEKNTKHRWD